MPDAKAFFCPEHKDSRSQQIFSAMTRQQPLHRSDSMEATNDSLLRQQSNEQVPGEVFGNGRLVKPKVTFLSTYADNLFQCKPAGLRPSVLCLMQSEVAECKTTLQQRSFVHPHQQKFSFHCNSFVWDDILHIPGVASFSAPLKVIGRRKGVT